MHFSRRATDGGHHIRSHVFLAKVSKFRTATKTGYGLVSVRGWSLDLCNRVFGHYYQLIRS